MFSFFYDYTERNQSNIVVRHCFGVMDDYGDVVPVGKTGYACYLCRDVNTIVLDNPSYY